MLAWREYGVPIFAAVFLHAMLLAWLSVDFSKAPRKFEVKEPAFIQANLVKLKPPAPPQPEPEPMAEPVVEEPLPVEEKEVVEVPPKEDPRMLEEAKRAEQYRLDQEKKQKEEEMVRQQKEEERLARERELERKKAEQRRRQDELLSEMEKTETVRDAAADEKMVLRYVGAITRAIQAGWIRPPSARNGMQVLLSIQLIPTGEVIDVTVVRSSGNEAFDRSAISAVKKAGRFPELAGMESRMFEKNFRRFTLSFKPEDLRL